MHISNLNKLSFALFILNDINNKSSPSRPVDLIAIVFVTSSHRAAATLLQNAAQAPTGAQEVSHEARDLQPSGDGDPSTPHLQHS